MSLTRRRAPGSDREDVMNEIIQKMRKDGYPYKIKGNGGYTAVLYDMQPLFDGDYMAIYRYPRGECYHDLLEIQEHFRNCLSVYKKFGGNDMLSLIHI